MGDRDAISNPLRIIAHDATQLLILGSLPGEQSLKAGQYYANPRNQFWRLMTPVVDVDLVALPYPERLAALLAAGVGLWDVVASAERKGSLDSAIRNADAHNLRTAIAALPALRAMAFNGSAAFKMGARQLEHSPSATLIPLPSSSAAHAVSIAAKQEAWGRLREFLT